MTQEPPKCKSCGQQMVEVGHVNECVGETLIEQYVTIYFYQCPECKNVVIQ